jgi:hypothetical protein
LPDVMVWTTPAPASGSINPHYAAHVGGCGLND